MKVKLNKIVDLNPIYDELKNKILSPKTSYKLVKFFKNVKENVEFYQQQIALIINEYGMKDNNGNLIEVENGVKIKSECLADCNKKINELIAIEVEIPELNLNEEEISDLGLSLEQMILLDDFIEKKTD